MKALKFSVLILVAAFSQLSLSAQQLQFDKIKHDFGVIYDTDGPQTCTFTVTNIGDKPLVLNDVRPGCGCTTSDYTKDSIAPGKTGFIKATFNPKGYNHPISKGITVRSNSLEQPVQSIRIEAHVKQKNIILTEKYRHPIGPVRLHKKSISYGKINTSELKTDTIGVWNSSDSIVTLQFENVPEHLAVSVEPKATLKPNQEAKIVITYDPVKKNDFGPLSDRIYLKFKGQNIDYKNRIYISANIFEDFSLLTKKQLKRAPKVEFKTLVYSFDTIQQGAKIETTFPFQNIGKETLAIRKVKTTCGCTAGKLEKREYAKKEEGEIIVTFNSRNKRGFVKQRITVVTNDPANPLIELYIQGFVVVPIQ